MENQLDPAASPTSSASSSQVNQPSVPLQMLTKTNLIVSILITWVVSASVFGIAGYYFGKQASINQSQSLDQNEREVTQSVILSPTPRVALSPTLMVTSSGSDLTEINTSSWKTHIDTTLGVQFKYPSDRLVYETDNDASYDYFIVASEEELIKVKNCIKQIECYSYPIAIDISSEQKSANQSLDNFLDQKWKGVERSQEYKLTVDGKSAFQTRAQGIGLVVHTYVDLGENVTDIYGNVISNQEVNNDIFYGILSTFKFIN